MLMIFLRKCQCVLLNNRYIGFKTPGSADIRSWEVENNSKVIWIAGNQRPKQNKLFSRASLNLAQCDFIFFKSTKRNLGVMLQFL